MNIKFGQIKKEEVGLFDAGILYAEPKLLLSDDEHPFDWNAKAFEDYLYNDKLFVFVDSCANKLSVRLNSVKILTIINDLIFIKL